MIAKQLFRVVALVGVIAVAACSNSLAPCTPGHENIGDEDVCSISDPRDLDQ
jgi:hypothetical protein